MKRNFTFVLFSALALKAIAQCNPAIPSGAVVLSISQSDHGLGPAVWICTGAYDSTNSIGQKFFLEVGATLYGKNGIGNTAYVPKGAKAVYNGSAQNNTVYFVDSNDVSYVYSSNVNLIQCPSISYDYTSAPSSGCNFTTGIAGKSSPAIADIYPNPAAGKFTLKISDGAEKISFTVDVFDLLGNKIKQFALSAFPENEIDLSSMPHGMYFVKIILGEKEYLKRIIIQ